MTFFEIKFSKLKSTNFFRNLSTFGAGDGI